MHKVLILGLGISGMSIAKQLLEEKISIVGLDQHKKEAPFPVLYDRSEYVTREYDAIIKSPGVFPQHPVLLRAKELGIPIISDVEWALQRLPQGKVIGITGTVGKTTTTLFLTHLLKCLGYHAIACGNVGVPLSDLRSPYDFYCLELSSFQLEYMRASCLDGALWLNIFPNHLDYHGSMEYYIQAKRNIVVALKEKAPLVLGSGYHLEEIVNREFLSSVGEYQEMIARFIIKQYSSRKIWVHDRTNYAMAAALAAAFTTVKEDPLHEAMMTFQKPPHRLEYVGSYQGVDFVNDSKATTPHGVLNAIRCFDQGVHLIVGGRDKGLDFSLWNEGFHGRVQALYVIGEAREKIMKQVQGYPTYCYDGLEEALACAIAYAKKGECIVLSPGCSSLDRYQNYEERGDAFKRYIYRLGGRT